MDFSKFNGSVYVRAFQLKSKYRITLQVTVFCILKSSGAVQQYFYFTQLGSNPPCSFYFGLQVVASFYALAHGCYHVSVLSERSEIKQAVGPNLSPSFNTQIL